MHVEPFHDPQTSTLTYVVSDPDSHDAVVIDPVLDYDPASGSTSTTSVDQVSAYLRREGLRLHHVLETHAHADHLSSSQLLRRRFDATVAIGERIREVQETFRPIFDLPDTFATDGSQFDRLLADGEVLRAGTLAIEVIATPGHTPACVTYRIGDATHRLELPGGIAEVLNNRVTILASPRASTATGSAGS